MITSKLLNIGYGNIVMSDRIIAIVSPDSAPIKRLITEAKEKKTLVDATYGRRTRSVILTDADKVVLSPLQPETLAGRVQAVSALETETILTNDET